MQDGGNKEILTAPAEPQDDGEGTRSLRMTGMVRQAFMPDTTAGEGEFT